VPMVADVEVLAEHTAQIAAGKENRAGAAAADKHAFFAEMRTDRANYRYITYAAKAQLIIAAMNSAPAWTKRTGIH
jgi:hypothetical protein